MEKMMKIFGLVISCGGFKTTLYNSFELQATDPHIHVIDVDVLCDFMKNDKLKEKWLYAKENHTAENWKSFNDLYYVEVKKAFCAYIDSIERNRKKVLSNRLEKIFLLAHHWEILHYLNIVDITVLLMKEQKFDEVYEAELNVDKKHFMIVNRNEVKLFQGVIKEYEDVTDLKNLIDGLAADVRTDS